MVTLVQLCALAFLEWSNDLEPFFGWIIDCHPLNVIGSPMM